MVTSDALLRLIADLQSDMTVTSGRRTLLKYAQSTTGAHLALLFVFDKDHQTLVLLEQSGRRTPGQPQTSPPASHEHSEHFNTRRISSQGLFGSVLDSQVPLYIAHAFTDTRVLKEEQYWIGTGGRVILSALGQQQGVLVLCLGPGDKPPPTHTTQAGIDEGNLLISTTLLSAYLSPKDKRAPVKSRYRPGKTGAIDLAESTLLRSCPTGAPDDYEIRLQAAIDQERSRIARDIHDGAAQNIIHVIHKLEFIQRVLEKQPELAVREISRTSAILKESLNDLRHGISSIMPAQLEEHEFDIALETLMDDYMRDEPALKIDFERENFTFLPLSLQASIFRFIQEALNNVRKHAQASRATIRIRVISGLLLVEVSDNGKGLNVEQVLKVEPSLHMGLRAMRDRVQQAGGKWEIQSKRGEGTTVKARFPLATPSVILTKREREVLRLLVEGLTNRAIAEKLSVSSETIKSHVHHIMQKMQVNDRTQAAVIATKQQWL